MKIQHSTKEDPNGYDAADSMTDAALYTGQNPIKLTILWPRMTPSGAVRLRDRRGNTTELCLALGYPIWVSFGGTFVRLFPTLVAIARKEDYERLSVAEAKSCASDKYGNLITLAKPFRRLDAKKVLAAWWTFKRMELFV